MSSHRTFSDQLGSNVEMMSSSPYEHGGDPTAQMALLGISPREVVDFSVNVSPLGVPEKVRSAWPSLLECVASYPTAEGNGVFRYYKGKFGLSPACVLPCNGSAEGIHLALSTMCRGRVAVVSPTFCEYERALSSCGCEVVRVFLNESKSFAPLCPEALHNALSSCDAMVLCNPNNPTGTRFSADTLLWLSESFPEKKIFVDEAFVQFLEHPASISLLSETRIRPNLLVFHSLTKLYAVPGLRLGAVIGHPDVLARISSRALPWRVNAVGEAIAPLLAQSSDYENVLRDLMSKERARIEDGLSGVKNLQLFNTEINFFLAKWNGATDLDDFLRHLLRFGVCVRDCRNFPGLEAGFFRFGIRLPHENNLLISAIEEAGNG